MKTAIRRATLATLLAFVAAVATANTLDAPAQRVVKFDDLNLATSSGVARLYSRIRSAAREVCEPVAVWNVAVLLARQECMQRAIEQAVDDVNDPMLKSYHDSRTTGTLARR
ncbi:MAG TPA: UrcA family protein [Steroidobacteraceae bacterium]|nr:UrcA family protein [Steroidobacteraceae bacterium]